MGAIVVSACGGPAPIICPQPDLSFADELVLDAERLTPGQANALASGDPADAPLVSFAATGGLCWTRDDGRVACTGHVYPVFAAELHRERTAVLLPDVLRHPRALSVTNDALCMLDQRGVRVCAGRAIERATGSSGLHRFHDGAWRALALVGDICGIRASDDALLCFATGDWPRIRGAAPARPGPLGAYATPLDGPVAGVDENPFGHWLTVFTSDRVVRHLDGTRAGEPLREHRFDRAVTRVTSLGQLQYVHLDDGSVLAHGVDPGTENPYGSGYAGAGRWVTVPALQGARVHSDGQTYACALFADGAVGCWGELHDFLPLSQWVDSIQPVPALRGSYELYAGMGWLCGRVGSHRLRCLGRGIEPTPFNPLLSPDGLTPIDVDLEELGYTARELVP